MIRNRENAVGDLITAAAEVKLRIQHVEVCEDVFGRPGRELRAHLSMVGPPCSIRDVNLATVRAIEIFAGMGWDVVARIDPWHAPVVVVHFTGADT